MRHTHLIFAVAVIGLLSSGIAEADPILLFAAGGGGGAGYCCSAPGLAGSAVTSGVDGLGPGAGAGGTAGLGGAGAQYGYFDGGGGAGWLASGGDGLNAAQTAGAPEGAGRGGSSAPSFAGGIGGNTAPFAIGGYGGGGGGGWQGGGGGGGYSGGGGGSGNGENSDETPVSYAGGGGGSYISGLVSMATTTTAANGNTIVAANGVQSTGANGSVTINGMVYSYSGAPVDFFAPTSGTYSFIVDGAQGGQGAADYGGYGTQLTGSLYLAAGTDLRLVIGGGGESGNINEVAAGGGGGGTFIYEPDATSTSSAPPATNNPVVTPTSYYTPSNNAAPSNTPSPDCIAATLQAYIDLGFGGCTIGSTTFYNFANPTTNSAYFTSTRPGSYSGTAYDPTQIYVTPNGDPNAPAFAFTTPYPSNLFSLPQGSAATYFIEYNIDPPIDILGFGLFDDPFSGDTYVQADLCTSYTFAGCPRANASTIAINALRQNVYSPFVSGTQFADVFLTVKIDATDAASSVVFSSYARPADAVVVSGVPEPDGLALVGIAGLALAGANLGRQRRRQRRSVV